MAHETRKALIEKYKDTIAFVSENNLVNDNPVDMGVAFDMIKANAEAKDPAKRQYKMPGTWTEDNYKEFLEDCKELD